MGNEPTAETTGEDNTLTESPTEETNTSEVNETAVPSEKTETSTEGTETKDGLTGAERRIHKLVDKVKEKDSVIEDLTSKLAELQGGDVPSEVYPQYAPDNQGGDREITLDDLRTIARLEVEKERTIARINSEAAEAIRFYPELDKNSDAYDPDVNKAVTDAIWLEVQRDPSKSVTELADKYMRPYIQATERAVGKEKTNLAKQVSDGALKPVNFKSVDKKAEDMTIAELEASLEMVY